MDTILNSNNLIPQINQVQPENILMALPSSGEEEEIGTNTLTTSSSYLNGRWTYEEHIRFLKGCLLYGNNWKKVENYVKSRTSSQIRSHAQKFLIKLNKKLSSNQKESSVLATSIKKLSTYVRSASIEYDRSKETNVTMSNESTKIGIDLQILKIKNTSVDKEIAALKEDINSIKAQINELHKERKDLENDKSNIDSNIDELKAKIKELPYMIQRCEEDKKNLRTAIVLVKQKSDEIKAEIYKLDNNKEYLGIDLDAIIGYYQQAQVI